MQVLNWIDARFPPTALWELLWGKYVAPKNFELLVPLWVLPGSVLVMQIVTGVFPRNEL